MQYCPQAMSTDLVHTHSGDRVSKIMFKSTLPFRGAVIWALKWPKLVWLVPGLEYGLF